MKRLGWILGAVAIVSGSLVLGQASKQVEWLYYGGDQGGQKYSTLTDINKQNINQLKVAWQWKHFDVPMEQYKTIPGFFEATPLMIDGVLYVTTPYGNIAAVDAETGKELWRFDGEAYKLGQLLSSSGWKLRGTAFWRDNGKLRIFLNSRSNLFCLDAATGKLVTTFGDQGHIKLTDGLSRIPEEKYYTQSSPPVIYKNLVIMGSQVPDRVQLPDPVGYVQAIDARTGKRVWAFSVIPQSSKDPGAESWDKESWKGSGHANVWAPMVLDEPRGLLYAATSTPSSDSYGGKRPGAGLFGESLVCLDANTGKIKWYFQAIHHGLWDWDFPAPPNLMTITVDGKKIDAVAVVSKQAFTYVFDRVSGKPVWPILEKPVPTDTDVPGEVPFPTQPFPTKPPPFVNQSVQLEDATNLTPELHEMAIAEMKKFRLGPIYTPPSLKGSTLRFGTASEWGGAGYDPETGYLFVRAARSAGGSRVGKNDGSDPLVEPEYSNRFAGGGGGDEGASASIKGIPLISPPWAVVTAIDLNKGDLAWSVPIGEGSPAIRNNPLLKGVKLPDRLGSPNSRGGPLVTKAGLVFIGGGDKYFYALDTKTGKEVWRAPIDYINVADPMTYRTKAGKQYIVVATGTGVENTLLAYTLP